MNFLVTWEREEFKQENMNTPTLGEQFLQNLSKEQKGKIQNYYQAITNPDLDPDIVVSCISKIWEEAAQDSQLLSWLELVDYFYTDVEESECLGEDKRAYLSEYIAPRFGFAVAIGDLPHKSEIAQKPSYTAIKERLLLLECPDELGYILFSGDEIEALQSQDAFKTRRCGQCHRKLSEHRVVRKSLLPDS